jgi:hypothetical protein
MEERKEKTHMTQADVWHFTPQNYSDEKIYTCKIYTARSDGCKALQLSLHTRHCCCTLSHLEPRPHHDYHHTASVWKIGVCQE